MLGDYFQGRWFILLDTAYWPTAHTLVTKVQPHYDVSPQGKNPQRSNKGICESLSLSSHTPFSLFSFWFWFSSISTSWSPVEVPATVPSPYYPLTLRPRLRVPMDFSPDLPAGSSWISNSRSSIQALDIYLQGPRITHLLDGIHWTNYSATTIECPHLIFLISF